MSKPSAETPPMLYVLRASGCARAVVFARHRSKRWALYTWDLEARRVEPGGMFFGTLYARRCDVSPDGRYLLYFGMKAPGDPDWPHQFSGLSRAPWLTCLLAWHEPGTWTRGMHFTSPASGHPTIPGPLSHIVEPLEACPWNIESTQPIGLAAERRIGFTEAVDSPARALDDIWDQHRRAILHKRSPSGREELRVTWRPVEKGERGIEGTRNLYTLRSSSGGEMPLPDHAWLDWLDDEHLYGATLDGRLVVLTWSGGELLERWSHAFGRMPSRQPSPAWARTW